MRVSVLCPLSPLSNSPHHITNLNSPIANGSPTTPNTNGSLAKLFSPFPASSSPPAPLLAPVRSVSSAATPSAPTAAATQGQDESGSFNTLISDVASQAGTVNTQGRKLPTPDFCVFFSVSPTMAPSLPCAIRLRSHGPIARPSRSPRGASISRSGQ